MPDDFRQVLACVECSIRGEADVAPGTLYNVLHFQTQSAQPSQGDVDSILSFVAGWVNLVYKSNFTGSVTVTEIRTKSMYASAAPFAFGNFSYAGLQNPVDEFAHAPLMLLHGPLSSRHQSGKMYAFPPGGAQVQTGYPAAYYTNMVNALVNLQQAAVFAGYALAVASEDLGTCVAVRSIGHTNRLTYQKRRRVGFGR